MSLSRAPTALIIHFSGFCLKRKSLNICLFFSFFFLLSIQVCKTVRISDAQFGFVWNVCLPALHIRRQCGPLPWWVIVVSECCAPAEYCRWLGAFDIANGMWSEVHWFMAQNESSFSISLESKIKVKNHQKHDRIRERNDASVYLWLCIVASFQVGARNAGQPLIYHIRCQKVVRQPWKWIRNYSLSSCSLSTR